MCWLVISTNSVRCRIIDRTAHTSLSGTSPKPSTNLPLGAPSPGRRSIPDEESFQERIPAHADAAAHSSQSSPFFEFFIILKAHDGFCRASAQWLIERQGEFMLSKRYSRRVFAALPAILLLAAACVVANAQTFANIPALSFTTAVGGANSLPQVIAVTSTGAQMNFSVTTSTTTGGNWLTA